MSTTTDLDILKINYLTQAQYDAAAGQGLIQANEIYMTPASDNNISDVEVDGVSVVTDGVAEIDLTSKSNVGHTHTKSDITDFPTLATVATSGSYNDLSNKPTIPTVPTKTSDLTNDSNFISDASYVHTDNNYTTTEKSKLSGIAAGAEVNVQSDWSVTSTTSDAFIKNKPSIPSKTSDLTNDSNFTSFSAIVSSTQPTTQSTGDLWFKIVS